MEKSKKNPKHIAIIMDGNGRWAKARELPRIEGHRAGAKTVKEIVTAAREMGIKYLTLYAFSSENWKRPKPEVNGLFRLLIEYCENELDTMLKNGISFNVIGEWGKLPNNTRKVLRNTMGETEKGKKMRLTLALNYSARKEILIAVSNILKDNVKRISEKGFIKRLFTYDMPDPDLIIRTSGELRLSNFLLWQAAYSEFFFTKTLWPDFSKDEFSKIIEDFAGRERRYGGI
ncbi:isoprenyl transferase [bacterium]|nr:isoprenyl transferase [bacterium]